MVVVTSDMLAGSWDQGMDARARKLSKAGSEMNLHRLLTATDCRGNPGGSAAQYRVKRKGKGV